MYICISMITCLSFQAEMFMGCKDGEIEVGTMSTAASNTNVRMGGGIRNMLLGGEFAQLSPQLGEFIYHDRSSWPSPSYSSSSLHRSLSVGSPEYSSLIPSNATSAAAGGGGHRVPGAGCLRETSVEQEVMGQPRSSRPQQQQPVPPHHRVITTHAYAHGPARLAGQFHAPTSDVDAAMARAMLAVISSSDQAPGQATRPCGAFEPYFGASTAAPKTEAAAQVFRGQGMIKRALSILREIRALPPEGTGRQLISSNVQTNHVMSERKRREKLNESFEALRASLPPGTKRDKASVLASAMELVNSLKAEISELEGKNRFMEARLQLPQRPDGTSRDEERLAADHDDDPGEMVRVKIDKDVVVPRGTSSSAAGILRQQIIQLRVAAPVEFCGMIDLVLHILECLKTMRGIKLVSLEAGVQARQMNPIRRAILTIQIKVGDWDEGSFERSIARAVQEATASRRPETAAP
ncbi:hypothetical protein Taro_035996 [Colocasia esculenta]|uniref:BHLH domain-containing protein n=1 Tax=Colocasia esculenta TaxID=4460 RepID=A0A843WC38_COLES|nr:hypothetical protein [Colocasia esculenta]